MEDKPSNARRTQGKCTIDKITRLMIDPLAVMIIICDRDYEKIEITYRKD